jgi:cytochrome c-type biogenesis protein CcmH/NrfF
MPKKIKVVDVVGEEVKNEEHEPSVNEEVNDITTVDAVAINEEPLPDIEDTPKPKAKPPPTQGGDARPLPKGLKAKPRTKKAPMEVILETKEEPTKSDETQIKEEPKTDKVKKVIEQVKCPKCDKMMSSKSLRYTHEQNCKGQVVKTEELPVKRRAKKETATPPILPNQPVKQENDKKEIYKKIVNNNISNKNETEIPEELKQEVLKTIQRTQLRMKMEEDNINRLNMQIA